MIRFAPLKSKDILCLAALLVTGFAWIQVDQFFLATSQSRFAGLIIVLLALFYLQFTLNKPIILWPYVNTTALVAICFSLLVTLIMHVIINHDLSVKSILINLLVAAIPYTSGLIYYIARRRIK